MALPVILRPCAWKHTAVGKLQALPKDGEPITTWLNQDAAFLTVIESIIQVVDILQKQRGRKGTSSIPDLIASSSFGGISSHNLRASETSSTPRQFQAPPVITPAANLFSGSTKGEKVLAVISYFSPLFLLGVIAGYPIGLLILYLFGQKSPFARFHLIQAILLSLIMAVIGGLVAWIDYPLEHTVNGGLSTGIYGAICFGFYLLMAFILALLASRGHYAKVPFIGSLAEKFANRINKGN